MSGAILIGVIIMDYRFEILDKVKEIINGLETKDTKRITLDFDDNYDDVTEISINIELPKDYGLDYNKK